MLRYDDRVRWGAWNRSRTRSPPVRTYFPHNVAGESPTILRGRCLKRVAFYVTSVSFRVALKPLKATFRRLDRQVRQLGSGTVFQSGTEDNALLVSPLELGGAPAVRK